MDKLGRTDQAKNAPSENMSSLPTGIDPKTLRAVGVMRPCDGCGQRKPARDATYFSVGRVMGRWGYSTRQIPLHAYLCRDCARLAFLDKTSEALLKGWWSRVGILLTPLSVLNNILHFLGSRFLPAEYPAHLDVDGPEQLALCEENILVLEPFTEEILERIIKREPVADIAYRVSDRAGVHPAQVVYYIAWIMNPSAAESEEE